MTAIALIFSGQGAQQVGMGKSLYDNSPTARRLYDEADRVLGWSLKSPCFDGPDTALTQTAVCQPALYVLGYAVFTILQQKDRLQDVRAALGLSLGELTALAAGGAFDFATGLKVVAERGRLMQLACKQTEGAMASLVGGDRALVEEICAECDVEMANLNCPGQIVISGEKAKIEAAIASAQASTKFKMAAPLKVAGAYHSRLMEPARVEFEKFLATVEIQEPALTVFTNTTGQAVSDPEEIKAALVRQVVSPVLWEDCMRNAAALGVSEFYECGPAKILAGLAKRIDRAWKVTPLSESADFGMTDN